MGLGVGLRITTIDPEKLREWLDSVPETVREKEPANILALVFFVELLKEKEKGMEVSSNA